jgi:hypothetical protein
MDAARFKPIPKFDVKPAPEDALSRVDALT